MATSDEKAAKSFIEASENRLFNPYHFANLVKQAGAIPGAMLNRTAVGWFMLNEIDYRYGLGDPIVAEMAARIVYEVINDYEELPDYTPGRGLEGGGGNANGTWEGYEPSMAKTFIRRGADI